LTLCSYYDIIWLYMGDTVKLEKLQYTFPKLSEANQSYVLGLAEGLKQAQNGKAKEQPKEAKVDFRKNLRM